LNKDKSNLFSNKQTKSLKLYIKIRKKEEINFN
jgi:hypothetical protein